MKIKTLYDGSILPATALKLLLALFFIFTSRILLYFFNQPIFDEITFSHLLRLAVAGLRFDLVSLAVLNFPFIFLNSIPFTFRYNRFYQKIANIIFFTLNIAGISVNFIDIIYYRFTHKRMTFDIFSYVGENRREIGSLIPDFLQDFWFAFLLWVLAVAALIFISERIKINNGLRKSYRIKNYVFGSLKFLVIMILAVIATRGGLQDRPVNIINAGEYTQPKFFPLVLNTPFTIIKTKDEASVSLKDYFNGMSPDSIFNPVSVFEGNPENPEHWNVIIIILESFSAEYSGYLNPEIDSGHYKGYTPFLDSLMQQSLTFRGFANGEKSIDGIPAIVSGIPSLMDSPFLLSPYVSNDIGSVATLLKENGYSTAFFHGGTNGTMGFEAYTRVAGFDHYFGRNEFNDDRYFDGNWGIFDEEFLQYAAGQISMMKEPFLSAIFTLSSHHPYTFPEKYKNRFPKGPKEINESIGYADYSLRRFFETISHEDWFSNTLFVLTADHTYTGFYPFYRSQVGRYSVPIVFYHQEKIKPEFSNETVQHTDIFPSIIHYLKLDAECVSIGNSVFDMSSKRFAASYNNKIYQLIKDGFVYQFDGEKGISLYNFDPGKKFSANLIQKNTGVAGEMNTLLKAIIQQYNNRMIRNELIIKN